MEEQENQFIGEIKAIQSTSPLNVAVRCRIVSSLNHPNEETWTSTPHMVARILDISWTKWWMTNCTSQVGRQMQTTEVTLTSFTHGMSQDPATSSSLGTQWTPASKLEGCHQEGRQENRDWWDEVQKAAEDRKSWWNRVIQCIFNAEWTKN